MASAVLNRLDEDRREESKSESILLINHSNTRVRKACKSLKDILSAEPFHSKMNNDLAMLNVLDPLYISMACFGLHWTSKNNWFKKAKCDGFRVHCIITLLILWTLILGYFACYDKDDSLKNGLFQKLFFHCYAIQTGLALITHVYCKQTQIPRLLKIWDNYKSKYGGMQVIYMKSFVTKLVIAVNSFCMIIYITFLILIFTTDYFEQYFSPVLALTKYIPVTNTRSWLILPAYFIMIYYSFGNIQILLFTLCLNHLLKEEFKEITSDFSRDVTDIGETVNEEINETNEASLRSNEIEHYRQQHFHLCQIVTSYDNATTNFHAVLYALSIPIIIFLIFTALGYGSVNKDETVNSYLIVVSMIVYLTGLTWITASAAKLATAVRKYAFHFIKKMLNGLGEHLLRDINSLCQNKSERCFLCYDP